MNIFLTGFMGSGKSYWGRIWAELAGFQFIDLDNEIEQDTQTSIEKLFDQSGEEHFREVEAFVLRSLNLKNNVVVACGGGTPCFYGNMQWMNDRGMTVYLKAMPSFLWNRIKQEKAVRPLLKNVNENELLFFIEKKLQERENFYQRAKVILNAEDLNSSSLKLIMSNA